MEIPEHLVSFLTTGVSLLVGSRDASLVPAAQRAVGARIAPDRRRVTVFVPDATAQRTLANLRGNGRAAITFSRVTDLRTVQIKGKVVAIRPATEEDRALQETYLPAFFGALAEIGMPQAVTSRLTSWPSTAVEVEVESIFDQTPGPTAGRALGAAR